MNFEKIFHVLTDDGLFSVKDYYENKKLKCEFYQTQKKIHHNRGYIEKNKKCITGQEYYDFIEKNKNIAIYPGVNFAILEMVSKHNKDNK